MILFLTSSPCDDDGAAGLGIPFVFSEENGFAEKLRGRVPAGCAGAMAAAWPEEHDRNDAMAADFASAFAALGRPLARMTMLDGRMTAEEIRRAVDDCGVLLLAGGHVPTQNRWFREIGLSAMLSGFQGVVIGISAGSMNSCGDVYAQPEEPGEALDPGYRRFLSGLGLTDVMVLPHLQRVRDSRVDGLRLFEDISIPDSQGRRFWAIPDGSYVLQEQGRAVMCGESWELRDGSMRRFSQWGEEKSLTNEEAVI